MALKTGSVVELKSGGDVEMTVHGIIGDENNRISKQIETELMFAGNEKGYVYCQWFKDGELKSACFKPGMLDEI